MDSNDPREIDLLVAVQDGNFELFQSVLQQRFFGGQNVSLAEECLKMACSIPHRPRFVRELLQWVPPRRYDASSHPLHVATASGNFDALIVLLEDSRINVNAQDTEGHTALHLAVLNYNRDEIRYGHCLVTLLMRPDVDANRPDDAGITPLAAAVSVRNKKLVELMLCCKHFDLDSWRKCGKTDRETVLEKFPDLADVLHTSVSHIWTADKQQDLLRSIINRDVTRFRNLLLASDASGDLLVNPNHWYSQPFHTTCLEMACKIIETDQFVSALIKAGVDLNLANRLTGEAPLHVATREGNTLVMRVMLQEDDLDINVRNTEGLTAVEIAAITKQKGVLDMILGQKRHSLDLENVQALSKSPAIVSINSNYPGLLSVTQVYRLSQSPACHQPILFQQLYCRKENVFMEMFNSKLSDREREMFLQCDNGRHTPLQYACLHGLSDFVTFLLEKGADPNAVCINNKVPPIVIASREKKFHIVSQFLGLANDRKFDVNASDGRNNTALHFASKHKSWPTVVALVDAGANMWKKNIYGKPSLSAEALKVILDRSLEYDRSVTADETEDKLIFDYNILFTCKNKRREDRKDRELIPFMISTSDPHVEFGDCKEAHGNLAFDYRQLHSMKDFIDCYFETEDYQQLLLHPLVVSFQKMSWHRVRRFSISYFAMFIIFATVVTSYITQDLSIDKKPMDSMTLKDKIALCLVYVFLVLTFVDGVLRVLICRRCCNFAMFISDMLLIVSCMVVLHGNWGTYLEKQISVIVAVLFLNAKLGFESFRVPLNPHFCVMLKSVFKISMILLATCMFLISSFGTVFYVMFKASSAAERVGEVVKSDSDDGTSEYTFHVLAMLVGAFEAYNTLPFENLPYVSHFLFGAFVVLVLIVMHNLLAALAVHVTKGTLEQAQLCEVVACLHKYVELECRASLWCRVLRRLCGRKCSSMVCNVLLLLPELRTKEVFVRPGSGSTALFSTDGNKMGPKLDKAVLRDAMAIIANRN